MALVAFLRTRVDALNQNARNALELSPLWVRYGEPAVWETKTMPKKDWYVSSDPRITVDDVAMSATILANPQLIKANYSTVAKSEADRVEGTGRARADAESKVKSWDRGVVGSETVDVTTAERIVDHYDEVSIGQFCVASDPVTGDCVEWEERFKQVPVYVQEDSGEVDENGDPVLVDKYVDVTVQVTQDVYLSGQDVAELQGPQVKSWMRVGERVFEDLVPKVVDDGVV